MLSASVLVLMVFPVLATTLLVVEMDRKVRHCGVRFGERGSDPLAASVLVLRTPGGLHPGLPFFGITSEVCRCSAASRSSATKGLVFATPQPSQVCRWQCEPPCVRDRRGAAAFFAFMTMLICGTHGVKFFNWVGTMWNGSITFETPVFVHIGLLITFLFGGLTGVMWLTAA